MPVKFRRFTPNRMLVAVCCLMYFASYMTRLSYAAVISEIVIAEGIAKSLAALATTACFVAYGSGQLISGWLGDRYSPKWIIFAGLLASSVMNVLITLVSGVTQMTVIWGINGMAQAMIWPPLVKILVTNLSGTEYAGANVKIAVSSSFGTVCLYVFAPLCIIISGWRLLFCCVGGIAAAVSAVWILTLGHYEKIKSEHESRENRGDEAGRTDAVDSTDTPGRTDAADSTDIPGKTDAADSTGTPGRTDAADSTDTPGRTDAADSTDIPGRTDITDSMDSPEAAAGSKKKQAVPISSILTFGFFIILPAITLQALIRDGVLTWMPSYIIENFHLSSEISIFSSVIIPIFVIIAYNVVGCIHKNYIKDEINCAAFCFGSGAAAALVLAVFSTLSPVLAVFLAAIITGCMYGITLMLLCVLPARYKATGKTALISGILNSVAYIGSSLSVYGTAYFAENIGWQKTVCLWMVLLVLGGFCCIISAKKLRKDVHLHNQ